MHEEPPPTQPPESVNQIIRELGPASLLAAGSMVMPLVGSFILLANINDVGSWLRDHGNNGIAIYIAGFAVLAGIALLPTYASAIVGGWAFGFGVGLPAALCGFLGGALIGYGVARPTAAGRIEALLNKRPKWRAVRDALVGGGTLKTLAIVSLLRLPPNSPFAATNLVLAGTRVPLWIYLVGTLVGMTPRTALVLHLAAQIKGQLTEDSLKKPVWLIVASIVGTLVIMGVLALIAKHALAKITTQHAEQAQGTSPHTPGT